MSDAQPRTLALLVGGGPAPGINAVVAAATVEAVRSGLRVLGIYDGYERLVRGDVSCGAELTVDAVNDARATGGSLLRTSRTNPAENEASLRRCVDTLERMGVTFLVTIGGDDTTYGAARIAEAARSAIQVAAVPKTIDNDLPLPGDAPTFGFETARAVGAAILENLVTDARTTSHWYLVVTMGRKSGSLALGMCKAAGADLAVIPEQFSAEPLELDRVVNPIVGCIVKRRCESGGGGVAIVAEGIAERFSQEQLASASRTRDAYGHVRLAEVPLAALLRDLVRRRLADIGVEATIVAKDIGYELRCAAPVPFDLDYAQTLGYGAVRQLLDSGGGALMALVGGRLVPLPFSDLHNPETDRVQVRMVDVSGDAYRAARSAMRLLEPEDLREPVLSRIAAQTRLSAQAFAERFQSAIL